MRKSWIIGLALMISCFCAGCGSDRQQHMGKETFLWMSDGSGRSYGEQGSFIKESNRIYFMDVNSGIKQIICDNPECIHAKNECPAFWGALFTYVALEDDHLLVVTDYGSEQLGDMYLYQSSVNGENRKQIAKLGDIQMVYQLMFTEDYIIIAYCNTFDENLEPLDENKAGLYLYDRKGGCGEVIYEKVAINATIPFFGYTEETIYFYQYYINASPEELVLNADNEEYRERQKRLEISKISLKDKQVQIVAEQADATSALCVCGNNILYQYEGETWACRVETGERRKVSEEAFQPVNDFRTGEVLLRKKGFAYYFYTSDGELNPLLEMSSVAVQVVFSNVIYALNYDTEDGNGELVYWKTEDFMNGNLNAMKRFEE